MPFRRRKQPDPPDSPAPVGEIIGNLAVELDVGLERTRRLMASYEAGDLDPDQRLEAQRGGRHLAVEGRIGFIYLPKMMEQAPHLFEGYAPALRVVTRLCHCLLALSGPEPEPLALLTRSELDTILADNGADEWLTRVLATLPDDARRERDDP